MNTIYYKGGELSLIGLFSWDSISLGIACLGGLLGFGALSALRFFNVTPRKPRERKVHMSKAGKTRPNVWNRVLKSLTTTVWAIGTGVLAGALSD